MPWDLRLKPSAARVACIPLALFVTACGDEVISNDVMTTMYPEAFRPGDPPYLERDYEAGADFICDEIEAEYDRDICAEPEINWRT